MEVDQWALGKTFNRVYMYVSMPISYYAYQESIEAVALLLNETCLMPSSITHVATNRCVGLSCLCMLEQPLSRNVSTFSLHFCMLTLPCMGWL